MIELKSREITFQQYRKILLKQEFSDGVTNIHEHKKDITIPLIIHYYLQSIQNTTQNLSTLNHNVGFFRVSTGALA